MIAFVWWIGCMTPESIDLAPALNTLATRFTQSRYDAFANETANLAQAATDLCGTVDANGLQAVRTAWWDARKPWKETELVKFGPVEELPERLGPKLDRWPVNVEDIEALVAGTEPVDADSFQSRGATLRGLPVVEALLWSQGDKTLDAYMADDRRCQTLAGATGDVAANAAELAELWREPWTPRLTTPSERPYQTEQDVLDEWVNRMAFTVENIRSTKLGKPLGDDNGGTVDPTLLESRFSGRSLADARDALAGVSEVWSTVRTLVTDEALVADLDQTVATVEERLGEVPEPLIETLVVQPEIVVRAQEVLRTLQVAIQVDLAQNLSVTITFNDNDGD
ncbi:MAG: imelysin family protein [Myxococcota bacterium]